MADSTTTQTDKQIKRARVKRLQHMQDAGKLEGSKFHTRYSQFVRFFKQKSQALDKQDAREYNSTENS